jgi:subfamily B ATP-binding cassette protein MsbA
MPFTRAEEIRRIWAIIKPYWRRVALAALVSAFVSGLNTTLAWLVKDVMDGIFINKNTLLLAALPFAVLGLFSLRGTANFAYEYLMQSATQKLVMSMRNSLYEHILRLPMSHFMDESSGSLMSRVISDTRAVQDIISITVKQFLIEAMTVIALVCYAFWLKWDLTLIAVVLLPVALYGAGRLAMRLKKIGMRMQEKTALIMQDLSESFTGIKIIKSFLRESVEKKNFMARNRDYYRENMRSVRVKEASAVIMELFAGVGIGFLLWYGGRLVVKGSLTTGEFTSFLAAMFLVYTPAKRLSRVFAEIQQLRAPLERISNVMALPQEREGTLELSPIKSSIEFRDVHFAYSSEGQEALHGISLHVKKGEIIAIVGESGSGKTTLMNLLPRFISPVRGSLLIDGMDIGKATLSSLRSQFGMVSQDVILFNDTVRANIAFGRPDASEEEIIKAARAAYAHDFIMELPDKYESTIGEKGVKLSGGQRQRISIARAILRNPPILILDEATSSLDAASELMVQMALENLMKERTTFVIAHRLSTISKATKIVVLDKGRVVAIGTEEELMRNSPIYQGLYKLQFGLKSS